MRRPLVALSASVLLLAAFVGMAPSASAAAVACSFSGPTAGGILGLTLNYVYAEANDNCNNTVTYVFAVCVIVVGPTTCAIA
jgi:hypothetical protein